MPTYEYLCEEGHEFEVQQKIKDDPLKKCTRVILGDALLDNQQECGAPCKRLISKTSFKFKGGAPTPKFHS
jgi:predicted nucleic acid-binding Zn ribbon protein